MKNYAIYYNEHTENGAVKKYLTSKDTWSSCANFTFKSAKQAMIYAKEYKIVENRPKLGSDSMPFIVGPKGGIYSIFSGEYIK
jgi:hypothetical protein